ncbi:hypothetical protein R3P38DRAFT_3245742 [Favolaschia claudopus]|uniref:Uncharacterized protein n=1 Tax=Favolaschia claudopus TaxID=2862362 RepID=A0AAV9Z010_9AGAR
MGSLFARVTNAGLPSLFPSPHLSLIARPAPRLPRHLPACDAQNLFGSLISHAYSLSGQYHAAQRPYQVLDHTRHPARSARNPPSTAATTLGFLHHIIRLLKKLSVSRIGSPAPANVVASWVSGSPVPPL